MESRGRRMWRTRRARWLVAAGLLLAVALYIRVGPVPDAVLDIGDARPSVQVFDRHGERLYEARSERGTRGTWLPPDQLPPTVVAATLAAEDHRFWSHPGVDPIAITRAFWRNLREWQVAEGGSTLSQQVVSLAAARAGRPIGRGWFGKLREALLALRVEHRLDKHDILARYLAFAPYGNQVEGIARASTYYFGVPAQDLTPAQAAYLAALPQRPGRFNPRRDTALAQPRQHRILRRMFDEGWLSADALQVALAERIQISASEPDAIAPHWVQRVLAAHTGDAGVGTIHSSLDAPLQRTVLGILRAQRPALDTHSAQQVSVVVLDNHTQEWRVWVTDGSDIDAAMTPRQPGSALKPFTYAAAFERGWHPGRVLADVPSTFPTAEPGILYSPRNYDGQFRGPLRARLALAGSENVPAVALAADIGVPAVIDLLRRTGISTLNQTAAHYGLGLTLGNAEVRLDELVRAYSLFAKKTSGGFLVDSSVATADKRWPAGNERGEKASRQVLGGLFRDRTVFWIADILADPEARRYIFGEGSSLDFPFVVAAKTGTSQAYHDNWTIGFTADVTVGVWVGNLDRTPLRYSSGVTGAGPIFHAVMLAAVEHARGTLPLFDTTPIHPVPPDLREATLCADSGMAAGASCPARVREHLPHDAFDPLCTWHHASDDGVITVLPPTYHQWALRLGSGQAAGHPFDEAQGRSALGTPSTGLRTSPQSAANAALTIVSPPSGATYLIDPTLRPDFQTLPLRAEEAVGRVEWSVNGRVIGTTLGNAPLAWPLARGRHTITAIDANGRTTHADIVVK